MDERLRDEVALAFLARVEDWHDVGMMQLSRRLRFSQEPTHPVGGIKHTGMRHLQRDVSVELRVVGPIDSAGRSRSQFRADLEASDGWGMVGLAGLGNRSRRRARGLEDELCPALLALGRFAQVAFIDSARRLTIGIAALRGYDHGTSSSCGRSDEANGLQ